MLKSIKRLAILAAVLAAVLMSSVASARPVRPDKPSFVTSPAVQTAPPAQSVATTSTPGFSWHDAGFGAAAMLELVAVAGGATRAAASSGRRAVLSRSERWGG